MSITLLDEWNNFHDWYLDSITIGPNSEPRRVVLGLHRQEARVTIDFRGVTCLVLDGLGLLNIVYAIEVIEPTDENHARVRAALEKGERLSDRSGGQTVFMYSTLGAELAIEFDALSIKSIGSESAPG